MVVLDELRSRYPGLSFGFKWAALRGELAHRGQRYPVVVTQDPPGFGIEVPPLDDFALEIRWRTRWSPADAFVVKSNDDAAAAVWLDAPSREALALEGSLRDGARALHGRHPWPLVLGGDRITTPMFKQPETLPHLVWSIAVAMEVASAPVRFAAAVAAMLGAAKLEVVRRAAQIALGEPAASVSTAGCTVDVTYLRRAPLGGARRLHTAFRAARRERGESWVAGGAARRHTPVGNPPRVQLAAALAAGAVLATATAEVIELWFEGAVLDPAVAVLAATTVAALAQPAPAAGPYR